MQINKLLKNDKYMLIFGILMVTLLYMPYFFLQGNAFYRIHDQLDQDAAFFLLNAKYFYSPSSIYIDEMFNGATRSSIQISNFMAVFFNTIMTPIHAWILNCFIVVVYAFSGMFLLLCDILDNEYKTIIAFGVAISFILLPFVQSPGLSYMGIPFVIFSIRILSFSRSIPRWKTNVAWFSIVLFAAMSSMVYSGYYVVGILFFLAIASFKFKNINIINVLIEFALVLFMYIIAYYHTILTLFMHIEGHRKEWEIGVTGFLGSFMQMLLHGQEFTYVYSFQLILPVTLLIVILNFCKIERFSRRFSFNYKEIKYLNSIYALVVVIAAWYAFYHSYVGVHIRHAMGVLGTIQFDRLYTMYPALWCIIAGLFISIMCRFIVENHRRKKVMFIVGGIAFLCLFSLKSNSLYRINWNTFLYSVISCNGDFSSRPAKYTRNVSWNDYFDEELFTRIRKYIANEAPNKSYKVAGIGLSPSVTQYNGFYTLDGYSVNYPLQFKHDFREIIAGELDKNDEMKRYFDNWGNRVYMFIDELEGNPDIFQKDKEILCPELNSDKFYNLGGRYILSAVKIIDANKIGLSLEKKFESKINDRAIYLYKVVVS